MARQARHAQRTRHRSPIIDLSPRQTRLHPLGELLLADAQLDGAADALTLQGEAPAAGDDLFQTGPLPVRRRPMIWLTRTTSTTAPTTAVTIVLMSNTPSIGSLPVT